MAVRKRGRSWETRFQLGGQQIARSLGPGSKKRDAEELENKIRRDFIDGKLGHAPQRTISEAIERWLDGEAKGHADSRGDEQRARMWLPWVEGGLLSDATTIAARASDAWIAAGLSPATINRRIALLRRVCRLAHSKWGWLDQDISRRLVAISGERQRKVFLSREEVMSLVQAAPKALGDAILLSAYTGLRQSELLRLVPSDVADGCVLVRQGKSRTSIRTVPVPRQALPILKRLPIPLTVNQLSWAFRALRAKLGMNHVRWHDLRHSYGSWLAQSGASGPVIRDVMGHSNLSVTSRYLHTALPHVKAAIRKLK